jgi:hypothetical protein
LCYILIEFGIHMNLVWLIKICLKKTHSTVRVAKHIKRGLIQGDALSPTLFNFALEYSIRRVQVSQDGLKLMVHISFKFMLMLIKWAEAYILKSKRRFSSCWKGN